MSLSEGERLSNSMYGASCLLYFQECGEAFIRFQYRPNSLHTGIRKSLSLSSTKKVVDRHNRNSLPSTNIMGFISLVHSYFARCYYMQNE